MIRGKGKAEPVELAFAKWRAKMWACSDLTPLSLAMRCLTAVLFLPLLASPALEFTVSLQLTYGTFKATFLGPLGALLASAGVREHVAAQSSWHIFTTDLGHAGSFLIRA